jgi:crossover junction endodeoxyribonuclease RuvC
VLVALRPSEPRQPPSEVKAAVAGNGCAGKAQVTGMVTKILALQAKLTSSDAADALGLAICDCWRAPMIARMAAAQAGTPV